MNISKIQQDYEVLRNEYQVCKQKLNSKCEALLILTHDLDRSRQERDQFKLMAEQVQQRYQALKRQLAGVGPRASSTEENYYSGMKHQNLAQMLCEMRECNKTQQIEVEDLRQKHKDAQGDIKLLREQIARQRVGSTDEGIAIRHFPAHEREDLVKQLEASKEQIAQLERDVQQVLDEKEEQETERDVFKNKYERLNQEVNYILKGDENRIVDIDALVMENKYLQKRIDQMEEEKTMAMATVSKYKNLLERKKNKGILKLGQSRAGGVVISQRQVKELLHSQNSGNPTPQVLSDLQSLATALLETVNDKNLALQHQRKTNKILGGRVSELEKKLKTLEVSGLWSISGKPVTIDKLKLECEEIKTLIPHQLIFGSNEDEEQCDHNQTTVNDNHISDEAERDELKLDEHFDSESDASLTSPISSPPETPTHVTHSTVVSHSAAKPHIGAAASSGQLSLEDLDFLPTKDVSQMADTKDLKMNSPTIKSPDTDKLVNNQQFDEQETISSNIPPLNNENKNNNLLSVLEEENCVISNVPDVLHYNECSETFLDNIPPSKVRTYELEDEEEDYENTSRVLSSLMEEMTFKVTGRKDRGDMGDDGDDSSIEENNSSCHQDDAVQHKHDSQLVDDDTEHTIESNSNNGIASDTNTGNCSNVEEKSWESVEMESDQALLEDKSPDDLLGSSATA